jgi:hypothetical protein
MVGFIVVRLFEFYKESLIKQFRTFLKLFQKVGFQSAEPNHTCFSDTRGQQKMSNLKKPSSEMKQLC